MNSSTLAISTLIAAAACNAQAQTVIELGELIFVSDFSEDGSAAAGNFFGTFETFRWTEETGPVPLGRATVPVLGVGAGSPDISYDGTRVSATVLDDSSSYATFGVWTEGSGWTTAQAPLAPANSAIVGSNLASTWGLSGDGSTVTGFYWTDSGGAHPCTWSPTTGVTPLAVDPGRNARVNASNFDGTVVCGWEEIPFGTWQPTVWRNGVKIRLVDDPNFTTAGAVTPDGDTVVGNSTIPATQNRAATIWRWDGSAYVPEVIGLLPGSPAFTAFSDVWGVSDDGSIVVGFNSYSFNPGGPADGFVWTEDDGLMDADDFFAMKGFDIADRIDIRSVDAVSPDGSTFAVNGLDPDLLLVSMILRIDAPCVVDLNDDGSLNFGDVTAFLTLYGAGDLDADLNNDATLNFGDVTEFLTLYALGCP